MQSIDTFVSIENNYRLHEKEIEGINYWTYTRSYLFDFVIMPQRHNFGKAHKADSKGLRAKIRICAELIYYAYIKHYKLPPQVDILIYNHPRRIRNEKGYFECCYTTDILKHYKNSFVLEEPALFRHKQPIEERNIMYVDRSKIISNVYYYYIKNFQRKKYSKLKTKIKEEIHVPLEEIKKAEDIDIQENEIVDLLLKRALICKKKKQFYKKIIEKIRPKAIIEVVSYAMDCMILNELGKEYGIPTIEMQHGIMGDRHIAYNYGKAKNIKQFPTYEFVFSDYWKENTPLPISSDMVKAVGYPHFEHYLKNHEKVKTEKRGICFISEGTTGKELSHFALELSHRLDLEEWHLFYKLHPGEYANWKESYPWLVGADIDVIGEGDKSLYEIFSLCEAQIGIDSTALFEGMGFGLNTLIYKGFGSEFYEALCEQGYAAYVENIQECIERLEHDDHKSAVGFWKENATENIVAEINKILEST